MALMHKSSALHGAEQCIGGVGSLISINIVTNGAHLNSLFAWPRSVHKMWSYINVLWSSLMRMFVVSVSMCLFPCRHREARTDLLDEFQLCLQVLQWGPGVERGRGDGGDLQHCHHTQQLPQNQTPRIIEDKRNDWEQVEREWGGLGSEGAMQKERPQRVPDVLFPSLTFLLPSFSSLLLLSDISLFKPSVVLYTHTYPCCRVQGHRVYITVTFCITSRWAQLSKQYGPEC